MLTVICLLLWMADAVGCGNSYGQGSYWRLGPVRTEHLETGHQERIRLAIENLESPLERGQALWALGEDYERQGEYLAALAAYQEIVRSEAEVPGDLEFQMARARAHAAVGHHWLDPELRQTARRMDTEDGLRIYREVGRTITGNYVDRVGYRELFAAGMINLRAALDNEAFLKIWELEGREVERSTFIAAADMIERRALEDSRMSGFAARGHLRSLCDESGRSLGLPSGVIISEFIFAAGEHLDNYSAFLTGEMYRSVMGDIEGRLVGFGVTITETPGGALVLDVIPGGPADEAGIRPDDVIKSIDGHDLAGANIDMIVRRLRGPEGTSADVVVMRGSDRLELRLTRRAIAVPSVRDVSRMGSDNSIGYIRLTSFQRSTASELALAMEALRSKGELSGLVLDLRGNPGGLVDSAVDVASMFLSDGVILTTRGRDSAEGRTYSANGPKRAYYDLPLIVLTDHMTASASEIVAGAFRDHERAVLIGERTFGKGLVQSILPLDFGRSAMYLTTARYYGPQGESFQGVGIEPHVRVAMPKAEPISVAPLEREMPHRATQIIPRAADGSEEGDSEAPQAQEQPGAKSSDDRGSRKDDPVLRRAIEMLGPNMAAISNRPVDAAAGGNQPLALSMP